MPVQAADDTDDLDDMDVDGDADAEGHLSCGIGKRAKEDLEIIPLVEDEARFLTKLDLTLISTSALGVMCRYLDQVNITNAFNSGMKEDLSLYGKELNYANAIWSAAVGLFEAGHFPAVMYVCSSYYKPHELARRNTLIQVFTSVGPLFSGFLMAAVHAGLDGVNGLPGWRWILDGICDASATLARAKANWIFTEKEVELARARMPSEIKPFTGLFKWKDIKRWHTTWHVYLCNSSLLLFYVPNRPVWRFKKVVASY
ncbi:putative major facilitator superfamily transporter [Colletotrichum sublineola]|uniref:Putative major facilitator superfamily transporter n=1 Tax=Colletotrichum sublineola TaxID=1173701 RepID=A0A066X344_COLSU|nr:putative major facilitator superfamily transporter [Colletotrichum sublineola]